MVFGVGAQLVVRFMLNLLRRLSGGRRQALQIPHFPLIVSGCVDPAGFDGLKRSFHNQVTNETDAFKLSFSAACPSRFYEIDIGLEEIEIQTEGIGGERQFPGLFGVAAAFSRQRFIGF